MNDRPISPATSLDEFLEQQTALMLNLPPCGAKVVFRIDKEEDGQVGAQFWFDASDVQSMAEEMIKANPQTTELRGAAKWTSRRDPGIESPTPVPPILMTFNQIAFKLIESEKGHVKCPLCNEMYEAKVLAVGHRRVGGYCFKTFSCPSQHELINTLEMHLLLCRRLEPAFQEEPNELVVNKFTGAFLAYVALVFVVAILLRACEPLGPQYYEDYPDPPCVGGPMDAGC